MRRGHMPWRKVTIAAGRPQGEAPDLAGPRKENMADLVRRLRVFNVVLTSGTLAPLPAMARLPLTPADSVAVQAITARLHSGVRDATINRQFGEIHNSLNQTSAGPYEAALTELGKLLGADAYKPLAQSI